jgi:hypothetical protein
MQTRNKTYTSFIKGKFYEDTEEGMTLKIGKALIDMRHQDEPLVVRIPKLLRQGFFSQWNYICLWNIQQSSIFKNI